MKSNHAYNFKSQIIIIKLVKTCLTRSHSKLAFYDHGFFLVQLFNFYKIIASFLKCVLFSA